MSEDTEPKKEVWISCRASRNCPGTKATITFIWNQGPRLIQGVQIAEGGGRVVRYRCTTCNKEFHIG